MSKFAQADYPRLLELLELKKTITLDCDNPMSDESLDDEDTYVHFSLDDEGYTWGNFDCRWLWLQDIDDEAAQQKRYAKKLKTFVQPDGEIGLEISYLPGPPWGEDARLEKNARIIYEATRLSEAMTFDEYLSEVQADEQWVQDLHGEGGETYGLLFDVVPAGRKSFLTEEFEMLLEKPLWVQRKGKKYNVHCGVYQD